MHVLLVITKSNWGGAQRYVYDVAVGMKERGYRVTVLAGGHGELISRLESTGIATQSIPGLSRDIHVSSDWKVARELYRIVRELNPDILHVNSSKVGGLGALVGRLQRKKVVFTAHGWPFKEPRPTVVRGLIWLASWATALLSHRIIVPSRDDFRRGSHMPGVKKRLRLIYHGRQVEYAEREAARRQLAQRAGLEAIDQNTCVIGCVAELHPNKGHEYLLRAMVDIDAILFLIGGGELNTSLRNLVGEYNLEAKVFMLGHVSEAAALMKAFDVVALASVKEGLPYVLIEAALAGCPLVASRVGGIAEIVAREEFLCSPGDQDCLACSLQTLVGNESLRRQYGAEQEEFTRQKFSMEAMLASHREIYDELSA